MARLPSIDLLRVLTVIVIVWRHTWPVPKGEPQMLLATITVPFFFFLTGWLWRTGKRTVRDETKMRWLTLGRPYVTWLALIFIEFAASTIKGDITRDTIETLIRPLLGGSYAGRPFSTFWFISALFFVAIMMRAVEKLPRPHLVALAVLLAGVGALLGQKLDRIPLSIGLAIPCLAFAVAGYLLRQWAASREHLGVVAVVFVLSFVASVSPLGWLDVKAGIFGTPFLSMAVSVALIWSAIVLLDRLFVALPALSHAVAPTLASLASVAIVVVLTHTAVLRVLRAPTENAAWWIFPAALVGTWALALILQRSPLAPWFLGQDQKKAADKPRDVVDVKPTDLEAQLTLLRSTADDLASRTRSLRFPHGAKSANEEAAQLDSDWAAYRDRVEAFRTRYLGR